jgi:hypothetical protein
MAADPRRQSEGESDDADRGPEVIGNSRKASGSGVQPKLARRPDPEGRQRRELIAEVAQATLVRLIGMEGAKVDEVE